MRKIRELCRCYSLAKVVTLNHEETSYHVARRIKADILRIIHLGSLQVVSIQGTDLFLGEMQKRIVVAKCGRCGQGLSTEKYDFYQIVRFCMDSERRGILR